MFVLSKEQTKKLLGGMRVAMGDIEMGQLINAFDTNGDGEVSPLTPTPSILLPSLPSDHLVFAVTLKASFPFLMIYLC